MAKVLILAQSGFGKSSSIGRSEELGIEGLNPENTYVVSVTSKPLPFKGSKTSYPIAPLDKLQSGRRVISNNPEEIIRVLNTLVNSPYTDIVIDDLNYVMQDWYMNNALSKGWDAPKAIGFFMGQIFSAIEKLDLAGKNVFCLAHGENVINPDGRTYVKFKSTGKMVDEYVTPEGKFDIVLLGVSTYDTNNNKVLKQFLTNENEYYCSAKSPVGMFENITIKNDLGLVKKAINDYYN